jgi:glycosyltransferase involved in cell wall biosynthesis
VSRILWAGIGPGHDTGFGRMTREFVPRIRDLGHEVVLSLFGEPYEVDGKPNPRSTLRHPGHAGIRAAGMWEGMRVIGPSPAGEFRLPDRGVIWDAFGGHDPDLVLVLKDAWVLNPADYRGRNTAVWLAFDTEPLGVPDRGFFAMSGARAVCVSQAGQEMARHAGREREIDGLRTALYVPHGVDMGIWSPGDRNAARALLGLAGDAFIAGICAANIGPRKAWGEQLSAFAAYRREDPSALLLIHSARNHPEGMNLCELAYNLGLRASPDVLHASPGDAVRFGEHTAMDDPQMVSWYRSLDVLMAATYGEGFGIPIVEAMACGMPVIGTRCSAITEKIPRGTGWLVPGQRWWNPHHQAWWTIPDAGKITGALHRAARHQAWPPGKIREHALMYDAAEVMKVYFEPVLAELLGG